MVIIKQMNESHHAEIKTLNTQQIANVEDKNQEIAIKKE